MAIVVAALFLSGMVCGRTGPTIIRAARRAAWYFVSGAWRDEGTGGAGAEATRSVAVQSQCACRWSWGKERDGRFWAEGQGFRAGGSVVRDNLFPLHPPDIPEPFPRPYLPVLDCSDDEGH